MPTMRDGRRAEREQHAELVRALEGRHQHGVRHAGRRGHEHQHQHEDPRRPAPARPGSPAPARARASRAPRRRRAPAAPRAPPRARPRARIARRRPRSRALRRAWRTAAGRRRAASRSPGGSPGRRRLDERRHGEQVVGERAVHALSRRARSRRPAARPSARPAAAPSAPAGPTAARHAGQQAAWAATRARRPRPTTTTANPSSPLRGKRRRVDARRGVRDVRIAAQIAATSADTWRSVLSMVARLAPLGRVDLHVAQHRPGDASRPSSRRSRAASRRRRARARPTGRSRPAPARCGAGCATDCATRCATWSKPGMTAPLRPRSRRDRLNVSSGSDDVELHVEIAHLGPLVRRVGRRQREVRRQPPPAEHDDLVERHRPRQPPWRSK